MLLEDLARRTGAAIVFPEYTRVPHQRFPFQFLQTYEVLDHMVRHGSAYQLLVDTIAIAGDSAGGMLLDHSLIKIKRFTVTDHA